MNTARQCQHIRLISCMSQMEAEKALFIASGVVVIAVAYNLILKGRKKKGVDGGEQSFTINELQVTCQNIAHTAARNAFEFVKKPAKKWFVVRQYRGNSFHSGTCCFLVQTSEHHVRCSRVTILPRYMFDNLYRP